MSNPWEQIREPEQGFTARRVDSSHPHNLFWAKDISGRYAFFLQFDHLDKSLGAVDFKLAGIQVTMSNDSTQSRDQICLILRDADRWELFHHLCLDLIEHTRNESSQERTVELLLQRLLAWQAFMKTCPSGKLTDRQVIGLIGELWFLLQHLFPVFGTHSVQFWQGPAGYAQDFAVNKRAIEVKAHLATADSVIRISSLEQLHSELPELLLFVVSLGRANPNDAMCLTLERLIERIRHKLLAAGPDAILRFETLLLSAGYQDGQSYDHLAFLVTQETTFGVDGDFPRLTPAQVPGGVVKATYAIALRCCTPFKRNLDW